MFTLISILTVMFAGSPGLHQSLLGTPFKSGTGAPAHGQLCEGLNMPAQEEGPSIPKGPGAALETSVQPAGGYVQPLRVHEPQVLPSGLRAEFAKAS